VAAVVANVTVTQPSAPGWVSAWADGSPMPAVSNLNFSANQTVPNLAVVPVGADGAIRLHNGSAGTVQLIVDVSGYYLAGTPTAAGALASLLPAARVLDTRSGLGGPPAAVGPGADLVVQITNSVAGLPAGGVAAVVANVTVTQPSAPGWVSAWADGSPMPAVSNLNFSANQTVPNLAVVPVGADGAIRLHNGSAGTVHLIVDVFGFSIL
jgi:hypothetical protein